MTTIKHPIRLHWDSHCVFRSRIGFLILVSIAGLLNGMDSALADVYKYIDKSGNVYFSDEPLPGENLSLEWKRTSKRLVSENKKQSNKLRREQEEIQARIDARLEAQLKARTDVYALRPAAPVSGSMSVRRERYRHLIEAAARRHGLTAELLHAVIRTESAYQANARSHAGACGLMQLMPQTASRFRVGNIWDPKQNIEGGAAYLRFLLDLFDHDLRLALAGYNAGEGAVKKYGYQIPPYRETQNYVRKVLRHLTAERTSRES
ncbi:MAG TPA: lytic transglycosylase [Chromatiaceae bacterium]|jgi:soluble lytic murein transglycosylase-like protein|nr:MAG: lytic transglycosylase domain-containing protein [Thiohalocapsa sp. PB-PSB1]HBG96371.1 lytic transglycosylase [Chromatiaceae bacterium]HCS91303.1 lytic transglycosylase [Chromatiaceae bacterium]